MIIANAAHTNSAIATILVPDVHLSLTASFAMLRGAVDEARSSVPEDVSVHVGPVYSSDFFYLDRPEITAGLDRLGTLGVEMESAALFGCALAEDAEALTVLTVSDHLKDGAADMSAEQRETSFGNALRIAAAGLLA